MRALVEAELHKLRTTRLLWGFLGASIAISLLGTLLNISVFAKLLPGLPLGTNAGLLALLANGGTGTALALAFGIAGVAAEYRHGTITSTFLATPLRSRVVAAKVLVHGLVGLVLGLSAALGAAAATFGYLAIKGVPIEVATSEVAWFLLGAVVATGLSGAFGAGLGWVMKGPVVALVFALVVEPILEPLFARWLPGAGRFLPTNALGSVAGRPLDEALPRWGGAAVYLLYVIALAGAGAYLAKRRDVT